MRRQKKTSSNVPFVKKDEEIVDGDMITILNEGQTQEGQFGDQFVIKIRLADGEERAMTINQTSDNNLIEAYGEDSINWVNKKAIVFLEKKKINGKRVVVAYLAAPGWERDEFGDFTKNGDQGVSKDNGVQDVNEEEIPIIYENE